MKRFWSFVCLLAIFSACNSSENADKQIYLSAQREAPLGHVYLRIFHDKSFEFESRGLERKGDIYSGTVQFKDDTLIFQYKDSVLYSGTLAVLNGDHISYLNGKSNESLVITENKFSEFANFHSTKENHLPNLDKLGKEIFDYAQLGNYEAELPTGLWAIGNNTFWKIFEIDAPTDSVKICAAKSINDSQAEFWLDFNQSIRLRMNYLDDKEKYRIVGFYSINNEDDSSGKRDLSLLKQKIDQMGFIKPKLGFEKFPLGSAYQEVFRLFNKKHYSDAGLKFEFQDGKLSKLFISRYQLLTEKGIRPQTSTKSEVLEKYGAPKDIRNTLEMGDKKIHNVEILVYQGISFLLLKDEVMLIIIE